MFRNFAIIFLLAVSAALSAQSSQVGMNVNLHPVQRIEISLDGFTDPAESNLSGNTWRDQLIINSTEGYTVVLKSDGEVLSSFDFRQPADHAAAHNSSARFQDSASTSQLASMTGAIAKVFAISYRGKDPVPPSNLNKGSTLKSTVIVSIEPS